MVHRHERHDADNPLRWVEGACVAGQFWLTECLGGGVSQVWRVEGPSLGVLKAHHGAGSQRQLRQHWLNVGTGPHLPRLLDAGHSCGWDWILLTDCGSRSAAVIPPMAAADAIELGLAVGEALVHLHHRGVIHRDVKPSNVMVRQRVGPPQFTLVDLDLALVLGPTGEALRPDHAGSRGFVPPESLGARPALSPKSDVWCLGRTLVKLLGANLSVPWPRSLQRQAALCGLDPRHSTERTLLRVIDTTLDDRPQLRPSAAALVKLLGHLTNNHPLSASPPTPAPPAASPPPPCTADHPTAPPQNE